MSTLGSAIIYIIVPVAAIGLINAIVYLILYLCSPLRARLAASEDAAK
jgi:ABC-type proline/glycine betaine transport system permease subunit